jgi:hypothetical protein
MPSELYLVQGKFEILVYYTLEEAILDAGEDAVIFVASPKELGRYRLVPQQIAEESVA